MANILNLDAPQLTEDEGTELTVHYLRMAAKLFEVTPDDGGEALAAEIARVMAPRDGEAMTCVAIAWVNAMTEYYQQLKVEQGD